MADNNVERINDRLNLAEQEVRGCMAGVKQALQKLSEAQKRRDRLQAEFRDAVASFAPDEEDAVDLTRPIFEREKPDGGASPRRKL